MDLAIETRGLCREFGDVVAVDRLDLAVETGTFFGFLGAKWLGPLLLAFLIVAEIALYRAMLRPAGQLLDSRRESLIEALQA